MNIRRFSLPVLILYATLVFLTVCASVRADPSDPSPTVASEQAGTQARFDQKAALAAATKFDLIMIGDSITSNLDKAAYAPVWNQFYAPRNALNLGFSGARTQNLLWTIGSGVLDGQHPKAVVLLVGTNNADDINYKTHYTAEEVAAGIEADVQALRAKLPDAKILMLRVLPYGATPNPRRAVNDRASELAEAKVVDWQHVFYADVNHVFLTPDGSIPKSLMPDALHPSPEGAMLQAKAIEPALAELMGDKSRDTDVPANNAVVPTPKLESDSYDWWQRHADELAAKAKMDPEVVLVGDSITHFWGGVPAASHQNGPKSWSAAFGGKSVLNLGFGWDRTQNVLWRLDHGEFDGLHPKTIVLNIGTNNFTGTVHARENTPSEVSDAIGAIVGRLRSKSPLSQIVVMGVFPRYEKPDNPGRAKISALNTLLATQFSSVPNVTFLDIGPQFLGPDGTISRAVMSDFTHPTEKGYSIWATALLPFLTASAPSAPALHVACVGDSITAGYKLADPATQSYPAQLQSLLGAGYVVENFGHSGATLLKAGDKPYWATAEYTRSTASPPDIVVIMLGTNDAKAVNWSHKADFAADYASLIQHYADLPSRPRIYIGLTPPVYPSNQYGTDFDPNVVQGEIEPAIRLAAAAAKVPCIDCNSPLLNHAELFFPDGVHPRETGAKVIASRVSQAILGK